MVGNSAAADPIPLLTSPLKGEELGKLALIPLARQGAGVEADSIHAH
jgi:hypothetical protein